MVGRWIGVREGSLCGGVVRTGLQGRPSGLSGGAPRQRK